MKTRIIALIVITSFLFTQCGLGIAAPAYKRPSNLRTEAIEKDKPQDPRTANLTGDLKKYDGASYQKSLMTYEQALQNFLSIPGINPEHEILLYKEAFS